MDVGVKAGEESKPAESAPGQGDGTRGTDTGTRGYEGQDMGTQRWDMGMGQRDGGALMAEWNQSLCTRGPVVLLWN